MIFGLFSGGIAIIIGFIMISQVSNHFWKIVRYFYFIYLKVNQIFHKDQAPAVAQAQQLMVRKAKVMVPQSRIESES